MTALMTPDGALAMYRRLVEDTQQALPMLAMEVDGKIRVAALHLRNGMLAADAVDYVAQQPEFAGCQAVTYSAESWLRTFAREGEEMVEQPRKEGVLIMHVDSEQNWARTQAFARTDDGVQWEEPVEVDVEALAGDLLPALRRMVSA